MEILIELALDVLFAGVVPLIMMAMLLGPLKESGHGVINYRGRTVVFGLGIVWIVWILAIVALEFIEEGLVPLTKIDAVAPRILMMGLPLVAAGCIFGLIDDAYGDSSAKGFKGHITALFRGRLTTGGLKLIGVGFASLLTALSLSSMPDGPSGLVYVIAATCTMALSANLMNLFDLRPGRAIKAYAAFLILALIVFLVMAFIRHIDQPILTTASLLLLCALPLAAIWRFDLGEQAMLGDTGANAMGALIGFLLVYSLPGYALIVVTVILLALNLASEKVSFSKVIEGNKVLRSIDEIGRLKETDQTASRQHPYE